eukprot:comp24181_c0_seq1/m.44287 comp24181_c0_seq1/g.44287  ORF comp24181_c0_seq1/g.44287 comp24181_c0_seq1/m.44287 type:complete len:609 (-) comp24181_c0_seq1:837-2663(-)
MFTPAAKRMFLAVAIGFTLVLLFTGESFTRVPRDNLSADAETEKSVPSEPLMNTKTEDGQAVKLVTGEGGETTQAGEGGAEGEEGDPLLYSDGRELIDDDPPEVIIPEEERVDPTNPPELTQDERAFRLNRSQVLEQQIYTAQQEYLLYMEKHVYGSPPVVATVAQRDLYKWPAQSEPHGGSCSSHQPGLVKIDDPNRQYCFGAARVEGARVCDQEEPNYAQLPAGQESGERVIYGQRFGYMPFYHTSNRTQVCRATPALCKDHVTVSSQGTWNRNQHVVSLATTWQGPISFALLLQSKDELEVLEPFIAENAVIREYVDIHVVWRVDAPADESASFYPINMLRNVALQTVVSGLTLVLDVDVVPNANHDQYVQWTMEAESVATSVIRAGTRTDKCPGLRAYIPPAVEMPIERLALLYKENNSTATISKESLVTALLDGSAQPMHAYFPPAYGPTNHVQWMTSDTVDYLPYVTRFEPYYIARVPLPLFDEHFVNRGGNYAQQVYEMAMAGYQFLRLPHAFVVDIPHTEPKKIEKENGTKQAAFDFDYVTQCWLDLWDSLPHRYRHHMATPDVADYAFRYYRRKAEAVMNILWGELKRLPGTGPSAATA